jgi:hypothetical protein
MRPYYEHDGITLTHGDAREIAAEIGTVDLIVTDPPYGMKWVSGRGVQFGAIVGDDGETSIADFLRPVLKPLRRGRHVYCFGAKDFADLPISGVQELIWDKGIISLGNLECPWGLAHERILFGVYNLSATDRKRGGGNLAARLRKNSILRCDRLHSEQVKNHPTQKPVAILRELIESSSMIGEIVFDPYAGSGSTLIAAQMEGRKAIGIEIEERYCEVAANRLRHAEPLSADVPATAEQSVAVKGNVRADVEKLRAAAPPESGTTPPHSEAEKLLYLCIRELSYIQSVENCESGLCATSLGEELIDRGMKALGVADLEAETLATTKTTERA